MKVCHMMVNTLPNTIFIHLVGKDSAHAYYTTLCTLFEKQSLMVGAEMRHQLGELKLKDGRDAHAHIEKIIMLHEDLASVRQPVWDDDLFNIIYVSLPHSYNPSLAAVTILFPHHWCNQLANPLVIGPDEGREWWVDGTAASVIDNWACRYHQWCVS